MLEIQIICNGQFAKQMTGRGDTCLNFSIYNSARIYSLLMTSTNSLRVWYTYMSQMLYAGQSAREIVTFLSDF